MTIKQIVTRLAKGLTICVISGVVLGCAVSGFVWLLTNYGNQLAITLVAVLFVYMMWIVGDGP